MTKRFLDVLNKKPVDRAPFWFMRQAGRYLPEYRATRKKCGSFLDLVYSPENAIEVTIQPLRRYGMDAAILFSDILVIPDALGQNVRFEEGVGPILDPIRDANDLRQLSDKNLHQHLSPIYETVSGVRENLSEETTLIGFAGAPWTVATYMVEGKGSKDHEKAKDWSYRDEAGFQHLIDILVSSTSEYLLAQVKAGAEVLQIFDTWAGSLSEQGFDKWSIAPTKAIIENVKKQAPHIPIIGFPRGAGLRLLDYIGQTGVDGISLDASVPLHWAKENLLPHVCVQGNLDPRLMVVGGDQMVQQAGKIIDTFSEGNFIFNLGHGFTPEVNPEHVAELSTFIKNKIY